MSKKTWIRFEERAVPENRKTREWWVVSTVSGTTLGSIEWYGGWRRYCYCPSGAVVLEQDCLRDIADFIERQTAEHKALKASREAPCT